MTTMRLTALILGCLLYGLVAIVALPALWFAGLLTPYAERLTDYGQTPRWKGL